MNDRQAFLRAIAEDVYDDTPRLVFADWLQEQGEEDRAEFIRVQCELEPMRDCYEIDRAAELHKREDELLGKHEQEWLGAEIKEWEGWEQDEAEASFRRGFVDVVSMPSRRFLALGSDVRRLHPTIRRVILFRANGFGERIAQCEALTGLAELELACWYSDDDVKAIVSSPYLSRLQVLELWLGRREPLEDEQLCRPMAESKAWPDLRELTLLDPDPETTEDGKRLFLLVNEIVGREVAVYRKGYPDRFPFASTFWYTFPGYLLDGRMAMAAEDPTTSPPSLCVIIFDEQGKQTSDIMSVPLPADILAIPVGDWYQHKDRMQQHLIDEIGFRPGFIRVQDCQFPNDSSGDNRPAWGYPGDFGYLDLEDEDNGYPGGNGAEVSQRVRNQEYIFGWDRLADKHGEVHST